MLYCTEGIVLKSNPYSEADLIVTYFTKDYGLISFFAKGSRKIKSKFGSSLEPLTYSRISFIGREDRLQRIIQSDIIKPFNEIRENYEIFLRLSEVLKLLIQFFPKREPNLELFSTFLNTLFYIQKNQKPENYIIFFKLKALKILGYLPDFMHCGVCNCSLTSESYYSQGFVMCEKCASNKKSYLLPQAVLKLLHEISAWRLRYLERVTIAEKLMNEIENFLRNHISIMVKV